MTFAQALARIEELNFTLAKRDDGSRLYAESWAEREELQTKHLSDLLLLARIAREMRAAFTVNASKSLSDVLYEANKAAQAYDALMKKGEKEYETTCP